MGDVELFEMEEPFLPVLNEREPVKAMGEARLDLVVFGGLSSAGKIDFRKLSTCMSTGLELPEGPSLLLIGTSEVACLGEGAEEEVVDLSDP